MISVAITTYNHKAFIAQAIESVLCQQCDEPIEVIISDDCSSDGTMEVCIDYASKYSCINYIRHDKNIGLINNYRTTILQCHGDFIAWLDGDDYWVDEYKLQHQKQFLKTNPSFILTYSNKYIVKDTENRFIPDPSFAIEDVVDLLCSNPICTPTMMCRAEYIKKYINVVCDIAWTRNWKTIDYPLWICLLKDNPHSFYFDSNYTAVYRIVANSGSHPINKKVVYLWDKQVCDIKYYYSRLNKISDIRVIENIFHLRKRMLMQYGLLAISQVPYMLGMLPYLLAICIRSLKRKIICKPFFF